MEVEKIILNYQQQRALERGLIYLDEYGIHLLWLGILAEKGLYASTIVETVQMAENSYLITYYK